MPHNKGKTTMSRYKVPITEYREDMDCPTKKGGSCPFQLMTSGQPDTRSLRLNGALFAPTTTCGHIAVGWWVFSLSSLSLSFS